MLMCIVIALFWSMVCYSLLLHIFVWHNLWYIKRACITEHVYEGNINIPLTMASETMLHESWGRYNHYIGKRAYIRIQVPARNYGSCNNEITGIHKYDSDRSTCEINTAVMETKEWCHRRCYYSCFFHINILVLQRSLCAYTMQYPDW